MTGIEQRGNPRYSSLARVRIAGFSAEAALKDLSVTGCRIEYAAARGEPQGGSVLELVILPEDTSGIESFSIKAEYKWSRENGGAQETGFFIRESPSGRAFERYVDFLASIHRNREAPRPGEQGGSPHGE